MEYFVDFMFLIIIYFLFFYKKWRKKAFQEWAIHTLMYIYFALVLSVTLMPFSIPLGVTNHLFLDTANFIPFRDYIQNYGGATREIILNVIMMIPFGFLYPMIKRTGIFRTVATSFLFSLAIETCQLAGVLFGSSNYRSFDVTDLMTNTFGGLIGYLIYICLQPLIGRLLRH